MTVRLILIWLLVFCVSCSKNTREIKVGSGSMSPSINRGAVVEWMPVGKGENISKSDIVIVTSPVDKKSLWIRRVFAAPGEKIPDGMHGEFGGKVVPTGNYFLLGDNVSNSRDSREFGFFKKDAIVGLVVAVK